MKIEKGKLYKTRDGRKVEILKTDAKNPYPIVGMITYSDGYERGCSWSDNGMYLKNNAQSCNDIIGEWEELLDFDPYCLPKWADKWIAMDENKKWHSYIKKPTLDEDYHFWRANFCVKIPLDFYPKNYSGDWKDSLFNVEQLKKDNKCQYK